MGIILLLIFSACRQQPSPSSDTDATYQAIIDRAGRLYEISRADEGVKLLDSSSALLKKATVAQKEATYLLYYRYYYQAKHENKKAAVYLNRMQAELNTEEKIRNNQQMYGKIFFMRGDLLLAENKLSEAYYNFYRGKQIANAMLDNCTKCEYTYRMGMIMFQQQDYRKAAGYFKLSFKERLSCEPTFNTFYRQQEMLDNAGLSYSKLQMNDSAAYHYNKALSYINANAGKYLNVKMPVEMARAVVAGNLAEVLVRQRNYEKAAALYKQSIAINCKPGYDNADAELTEVKLANLYILKKQPDSLYLTVDLLQRRLTKVPNLKAETQLKKMLAEYYSAKGNYRQAYASYKDYHRLQDSIASSERNFKEHDINAQLQQYERENELNNLKRRSKEQRVYLIVAVAFVLLVLLTTVLIFKYWRKSAKNNRILDALNKQINHQNEDLERALSEVRSSNQEKDRILHTVAHDLRNPIGGIASLSSAMVTDGECSEEQQALLKAISDTANDSLILISELLEVADNHVKDLNRQEVDINQLVINCIELLNYKAAEKIQTIKLNLNGEPQKLWLSREKIWRVLSNLISNAIKFSKVNDEIVVNVEQCPKGLMVSVQDNGIGIPPELQPLVFNMFTDAKREGTLGEKSFGLGLSICKQIIEQHSGKLWFESELNKGTTFYFTLPLK
jgi:signal transduction histidine kinase